MSVQAGKVFSMQEVMKPVPGCTTSESSFKSDAIAVTYFSLAENTDISAESYAYTKLLLLSWGDALLYTRQSSEDAKHHSQHYQPQQTPQERALAAGDLVVFPTDTAVGIRSISGCIYTEVALRKETFMNDAIKVGEALKLADLLPYQDGRIVNMDLAHNDGMKLALMSFDAGTGLDEHSAPGDALVFALEGEATIGYEGVDHVIHAGENFRFAKAGRHYVRADKRFKMALLITLS